MPNNKKRSNAPARHVASPPPLRAGRTAWVPIAALLVAVASLTVSIHSCKTAQDSLRISQQPYLSARTNVFTVRGMGTSASANGFRGLDNSPPVVMGDTIDLLQAKGDVAIHFEVEIENAGNTPAIVEELAINFTMPKGWELIVPWTSDGVRLTKGVNRASIRMETVAPNATISRDITIGLSMTEDARLEFLKKRAEATHSGRAVPGIRGPLQLDAEVKYRDEIRQREPLRWCKVLQMNLPSPLDCMPGAAGSQGR